MSAAAVEPDGGENRRLAARFVAHAERLEETGADPFRSRAWREAAAMIHESPQPMREVFERGGMAALVALPKIGPGIASTLVEIFTTGHWAAEEGTGGAAGLFASLPGIGPRLAGRLSGEAGLQTLQALEMALQPGQPPIEGIGQRRRQAILAQLAQRLGRRGEEAAADRPAAEVVLAVDADYRRRAEAGALPTIAPRRFNPEGHAWLPLLQESRSGWDFRVMFSNTALAHRLGRSRDWVVVLYRRAAEAGGRCTVVTETRGALRGRRVIRGREAECAALAEAEPAA